MKNAVVVLTRGYSRREYYRDLISRNVAIQEFLYDPNQKCDYIIFHEGNISLDDQKYISEFTPELNLIFKNVKEEEPKTAFNSEKNIVNYSLCPPTPLSSSFPLGYKHMCHFWSIDFLKYLKEYKYVVRIDEDCVLTKFDKNILKKMYDNQIKFISPFFQGQDVKDVIVGLESLWNNFISEKNFTPFKNFSDIKCPYTNFMIVDAEYFLNHEMVMNFLEVVDNSNGIYSNRWGDLPIWGVILSTLTEPKFYLEDKTTSYYHKSHNKIIN